MRTCPTCAGRFDDATFCPRDGTRLVDDAGRVLGDRYRLIRKVGEGAMGEVFEAVHVHINRRVAVKLLQRKLATDPEARQRLKREAQSTSEIEHPNIVESVDFGFTEDGQPYLVMEWLDGETLDHRLESGLLELDMALDIAAQAAAGLAEAHERGVIHRDLKPANLFLVRDRKGRLVVKVLDFGIAKLGVQDAKLTGTGVVIGTPIYMAPEQAFGEAVDARTDVYAMGVILYELVAGAVPFSADTPLAVLHQHTSKLAAPPSARAPARGITSDLDALVMRCLAKKPDERFASMHALVAAIAEVRASIAATQVAPATPLPTARTTPDAELDELRVPGRSRRRGWLVAVAVAGSIGTAALVFAIVRRQHDTTAIVDSSVVASVTDGSLVAIDAADDAATASTSDAAVADASIATIDARVDVVDIPTIDGRAKQFTFGVAITPAHPEPEQPFELTFRLRDPSQRLRDALAGDTVEAKLSVVYFRDHSVVHESRHRVDRDGSFTASLALAKIAKHHVRVRVYVGGRELDSGRFDLFAQ